MFSSHTCLCVRGGGFSLTELFMFGQGYHRDFVTDSESESNIKPRLLIWITIER